MEIDWVLQVPKNPALQIQSFPSAEKTTGGRETDAVARSFPRAWGGLGGGWSKDDTVSHGYFYEYTVRNDLKHKHTRILTLLPQLPPHLLFHSHHHQTGVTTLAKALNSLSLLGNAVDNSKS